MNDEIDLASDHQLLQFLGPQVLGCKVLQRNSRVEIAGGLLGEDLEFIVRVGFLEGGLHQIGLEQGEFGFASADGKRRPGGGGHDGKQHGDGANHGSKEAEEKVAKRRLEISRITGHSHQKYRTEQQN